MNKSNRRTCKELGMSTREYRKLVHWSEMYAKETNRQIDQDKAKHNCLYTSACEKERKNHPSWYLNGRTLEEK